MTPMTRALKRFVCRVIGHDERSDWFFGMIKHRRPRHMVWCHRCRVTLQDRRARRRDLKHIWPEVAKRWAK